jgi:hypothetical protein
MPAGTILIIVVACLLIAAAAGVAAVIELRQMVTRRQFGPEYERLARTVGHRQARAELNERKRRVAQLGIRPLDPVVRQELTSSWTTAQEAFVEDPPRAVTAASGLVLRAAKERGYPVDDIGQLRADLSVHHARRLGSYRRADETTAALAAASVPTEDLRQALLWYRAMFRELAESPAPAHSAGSTGTAGTGALRHYLGRVAAMPAAARRAIARPRPGARRSTPTPPRTPAPIPIPPQAALRAPGRLRPPRPRIPKLRQPRLPRLTRTPRRTSRTSQREGAKQA